MENNMENIYLAENLQFSRIISGFWRLNEWEMSSQELLEFIEQCIELGVSTFDHADIYGGYTCESLFGNALSLKPELREKMQIISKCGITPISDARPHHKTMSYDTSRQHILESVENSLKNLQTDHLDVLLIHRPSPLLDADEVAETFIELEKSGKVRYFGVSNFTPMQYELLDSRLDNPLVTNQLEISAACLEHFDNGNIDFMQMLRVPPMAWSPLAGGDIFNANDEKSIRLRECLTKISKELNLDSFEKVMYAWLLKHPVNIMPIVGSGKIERIKIAVEATEIDLDRQHWFEILEASRGYSVP
jgi:predicted oxidoreductase